MAYLKTGTRDPSGTPAGPFKNRKTGIRNPGETLETLENRNPIIIIIIIIFFIIITLFFVDFPIYYYNIMQSQLTSTIYKSWNLKQILK